MFGGGWSAGGRSIWCLVIFGFIGGFGFVVCIVSFSCFSFSCMSVLGLFSCSEKRLSLAYFSICFVSLLYLSYAEIMMYGFSGYVFLRCM